MAAYIAIIISSICLILLITILIKFKRLFSTESIIEKTKNQMNKIVADINHNANMDIDLINDATKRIRNLMSEADSQMADFREAADMLRELIALVDKGTRPGINNNPFYSDEKNAPVQKEVILNFSQNNEGENQKTGKVSAAKYKVNAYKATQQSLFDESLDENNSKVNLIPNIINNIAQEEEANRPLSYKVKKLYTQGMDIDQIVEELKCSVSEAQFIIDMLDV